MLQRTKDVPAVSVEFVSVAKIWDVVIRVTPVTLGGIVGDSQMIKSRKENKYPYDDDRNGAVWMLKIKCIRR